MKLGMMRTVLIQIAIRSFNNDKDKDDSNMKSHLIKQDVWLSKSAWQMEHLKTERFFSARGSFSMISLNFDKSNFTWTKCCCTSSNLHAKIFLLPAIIASVNYEQSYLTFCTTIFDNLQDNIWQYLIENLENVPVPYHVTTRGATCPFHLKAEFSLIKNDLIKKANFLLHLKRKRT